MSVEGQSVEQAVLSMHHIGEAGILLIRRACVQEKVFSHAEELFEEGDTNHDGKLSTEELQDLLMRVCLQSLNPGCNMSFGFCLQAS